MVSSWGGRYWEVGKAFLDKVTKELTLKRGETFADSLGVMGRRKACHTEEAVKDAAWESVRRVVGDVMRWVLGGRGLEARAGAKHRNPCTQYTWVWTFVLQGVIFPPGAQQ